MDMTETTSDIDQGSRTASDANCIVSLVSGRRAAIHAPTGPSSLAINKNFVNPLGACNTSAQTTLPSEEKFTRSYCSCFMHVNAKQSIDMQ